MNHKTLKKSRFCSNPSQVTELTDGFAEFVAIVDSGSISEAARRLGLPRASLSRRLAQLEARLGVGLLNRGTRHLALTPAGQELHARAGVLLEQAAAIEEAVRRRDGVPRGLLRISTPPLAAEQLDALCATFLEAHPQVQLEVHTTARHVDLIGEGFDVALRAGVVRDERLIARTLSRGRALAVASPDYLARHGTPERVEELSEHRCILGFSGAARPARRWPLLDGGEVPVDGPLRTDSVRLSLVAALRGRGIALVPRVLAAEALERGALVAVLPERVGLDTTLSVVYANRALMPPRVRAFVDHVIAHAPDPSLGARPGAASAAGPADLAAPPPARPR